jgi:septum site-determining protein MinD
MAKTVGIVSLKGGVGKTSSVVELGTALSNIGKKVLMVDANFSAPNLGLHLNIINPEKTLHDVMENVASVKDAIYVFNDQFHVLPSSTFHPSEIVPLKLRDKLKNVKKNYDVVLIDSSPSINDETLATMLASDELLVVTTPDYSTLSMTLKAVKDAKKRGVPISGLILNNVYKKDFELSLENIEETTEVPVMAVIPHDINVPRAQSKFLPLMDFKPKSEVADEFMRLASTLVGEKHTPKKMSVLLRSFNPPKQDINREVYYHRIFND